MLQRCSWSVRNIYKSTSQSLIVRSLLSASYTDPTLWEQRVKDPQNLAELASLMDRTYEKKLPVSSLTVSRFIDNISSRQEIDQAEYYLYKFRHSPNCLYLRDWTIHSWVRQCLKYDAKDKLLHTLKNKEQYGMFPDDFTFNLLIDSFIKAQDFKGACSVVEEVMLQEAFELLSTQILSLNALSSYAETKPELDMEEERNLGAFLVLVGLKQDTTLGHSARLLGYALLGKVEMVGGIHSVFHQMPLLWTPGYLGRALAVMETIGKTAGEIKLTKSVLDFLEEVLRQLSSAPEPTEGEQDGAEEKKQVVIDEDDQMERAKLPEYTSRFMALRRELQGREAPDSLCSLSVRLAQEELGAAEGPDVAQYQKALVGWEEERQTLIQREKENKEKADIERKARLAARAQRMASQS